MGIRPFVAIKQVLENVNANVLQSEMKGILVGPAVQSELEQSEILNASSVYGDLSSILTDAGSAPKVMLAAGLIDGANIDFDTLSFSGTNIVAKISVPDKLYDASLREDPAAAGTYLKYSLKIDLAQADAITIAELLVAGAEAGDTLSVTNAATTVVEEHKIRSFEVVGTDLYVNLWNEIAEAGITETTVFNLVEFKNVNTAKLSIIAPMTVAQYGTSVSTYSIDNTADSAVGGFAVTLYVYSPVDSEVSFTNRQVLTQDINTLSNYTKTENTYVVADAELFNHFIANRSDLSNNVFELNSSDYESKIGKALPGNKLAIALSKIELEVPGAIMKVYVTEDDSFAAYSKALASIASSEGFYSVTALTDNSAVAGVLQSMLDSASDETVAQWKMAVVSQRTPHFTEKLKESSFTVTQIEGDTYSIDLTAGGLLTVGAEIGDFLLSDATKQLAESDYYNQITETYSQNTIAKVVQVVTDKRIIVTTSVPGVDLVQTLSSQGLYLGKISTNSQLIESITEGTKSIGNKRFVNVFPDKIGINNGTDIELVPGYIAAAVINAAMAHLPPQQGLSNLSFTSFARVYGSSFYFTDGELDEIAAGGSLVLLQQNYSSDPFVLRQITTDTSTLETMEINKVRCLDYATLGFASVLNDFVGKRNVTAGNINEIKTRLTTAGKLLIRDTENSLLGSVITWFEIVEVFIPDGEADAINAVIEVETPTSLNKIRLFVKSTQNTVEG